MKNLNSFKAIARAIEGERERQIELIEEGKAVIQETRRWDDNKESSHAMRSKEDAQDYRYFPEPDLVPIVIDDEWIEKIKAKQPEFVMKNWNVIRKSSIFHSTMQKFSQSPSIWRISLKRQQQFVENRRKYPTG